MFAQRPNLRPAFPRSVLIATLLSAAALVACSETDKSEVPVAEVEDRVIMLDYFERKMNTMDPRYLPANINTREGRMELLEVMINKEIMAIKAEELGFAEDGQADEQAGLISRLKAMEAMRGEVAAAARRASEDEILDYYENLSRELKVNYMLFDTLEEARTAKSLVDGGEEWKRVAERMEAGDPGPQKDWSMTLQYGTVQDDLEESVFQLQVNETCDPVDTQYGYFIVRVVGQEMVRVAPLDTMRDKIIQSVVERKETLAVQEFIYEVFDDYNFVLNEEAVKIVFDAIPEDLPLEPTPTESLPKLGLSPAHFDMELMSWEGDTWDLGRYYEFFNNSSVFGRPRRQRRIGGLRRALREIAVRDLMMRAAEDRGFTDRPWIRDEYKQNFERAMVTRLHQEFVSSQVVATPQDIDDYWAANRAEFNHPEYRHVLALVAGSEEDGLAAFAQAKSPDVDWTALVAQYCLESDLKAENGDLGRHTSDTNSIFGRIAYELTTAGDVSYPREIRPGQWAVVKLTEIVPPQNPELSEVRQNVARAAQAALEEALFQERVQEWKSSAFIRRYESNLDKAVYSPQPRPQSDGSLLGR